MREFRYDLIPKPPQLPETQSWQAFQHMSLEIGAGNGLFAESFCKTHPTHALIALEKTFARSHHLLERSRGVQNLFAYQTDATNFVTHYIDDGSLENIFLLYPNPYLKKRLANQRWHNRPFMKALLRKLKPQGTLLFATNLEEYFLDARKAYETVWGLDVFIVRTVSRNETPRTQFEKKYLERGETCFELTARKKI